MAPHKSITFRFMFLLFILFLTSCNKDSDLFSEIIQEQTQEQTNAGEIGIGVEPISFQVIDDEFTIPALNTPAILDVLKNDSVPKNDSIDVKIDIINEPNLGSLIKNNDNTFSYTPDLSSNKANEEIVVDEFTYYVQISGHGDSQQKQASVLVSTKYTLEDNTEELKAFPSAVGAGAYTTGGRGGVVVHVTNLNDRGPGSLREALMMTVPRTIVFDVSGTITLNTIIELINENSNFTVAGQTAPRGGITISGRPIQLGGGFGRAQEPCNNAIWRYIRFRNGSYTGVADAYLHNGFISTGTDGLVLDHCSFSFNDDQAISMNGNWGRVDNITVSRSLFSENATSVILDGSGTGNVFDVTVYRNLWKNEYHRQPNYGGVGQVDIINNIHDTFPSRVVNINKTGNKDVNYIGNWIRMGSTSTIYPPNKVQSPGNVSIYTANNYHNTLRTTPVLNDQEIWSQFGFDPAPPVPSDRFTTNMHPLLGAAPKIESAADAFSKVTSDVGANKYLTVDGSVGFYLDSYDTALIDETINGVQGVLGNKSWMQPTLPENTRAATFDTDKDGMADAWEISQFGDLSQNATEDFDGDGYENIEEYLNQVDFD